MVEHAMGFPVALPWLTASGQHTLSLELPQVQLEAMVVQRYPHAGDWSVVYPYEVRCRLTPKGGTWRFDSWGVVNPAEGRATVGYLLRDFLRQHPRTLREFLLASLPGHAAVQLWDDRILLPALSVEQEAALAFYFWMTGKVGRPLAEWDDATGLCSQALLHPEGVAPLADYLEDRGQAALSRQALCLWELILPKLRARKGMPPEVSA